MKTSFITSLISVPTMHQSISLCKQCKDNNTINHYNNSHNTIMFSKRHYYHHQRNNNNLFCNIHKISIILVVIIFSILINVVNSLDHCSQNRFNESLNSTHMQFTKEIVSKEYSVLGQFKSLHCCAKGYRSIEW